MRLKECLDMEEVVQLNMLRGPDFQAVGKAAQKGSLDFEWVSSHESEYRIAISQMFQTNA